VANYKESTGIRTLINKEYSKARTKIKSYFENRPVFY
jgi:hypothetical protein